MPQTAPHRRLLPLLGQVGGGRSRTTCRFRCGDACFHEAPNTSDNAYFGDIAAAALSRRNVLRAGAVGAGATAAVGLAGFGPALASPGPRNPRLKFDGIEVGTSDRVEIPRGYEQRVVVRWGDPVVPGAPKFDINRQTAEAQEKQFGYNCDYVAFQPLGRDRGLLWVNHEYTNENLMFRGYTDGAEADLEHIRIAMAAHGGSVVEIRRVGRTGGWRLADGGRHFNRRITATTPMKLTGPAAGSELLRTEADPEGTRVLGMLNNCAGGMTPWGTILTCEENFNQYFVGGEGAPEEKKAALRRYGIATSGDTRAGNRRFDRVDERFDLSRHPNEANRFGYVVEIDPFDPDSTPRKRTMLGRFKHEGATTRLTRDGRVAVYMGDDERFDYIYKFVSAGRYRKGSRRANSSLLDTGTLYVARLSGDSPAEELDGSGALPADGAFDGRGEWVALCTDKKSFVEGFTVAEVLVHTRLAADAAGATKMDRPEDIEASPATGKVYCALTNNSAREPGQADEPNPRGPNRFGHILEIHEQGNDAGATRFRWDVPIVCGDPEDPSTYFAGYDKSKVVAISSPDNLTFDEQGNLWISTDGQPGTIGVNDALFAVPVEGRYKGELKAFASVPVGAECCGPFITEDQKTVFIAPQHPGEDGTFDEPQSTWPDGDFPRPSVVSIWNSKGHDIGR
ncbi:PhoX family protein [Streptomonospora nanhaiensis]|uniref:PhoX family protein n=1 Tax=Streptomonospora nanhaiensis TaxID=1323731 RepID=UPI001C37F873|nr:PhoX family phosphatase [Streptomonospora nanhaiensis]MBV2363251.1 PhoX family phosphatase [Streptomonospora nanhaiensis]